MQGRVRFPRLPIKFTLKYIRRKLSGGHMTNTRLCWNKNGNRVILWCNNKELNCPRCSIWGSSVYPHIVLIKKSKIRQDFLIHILRHVIFAASFCQMRGCIRRNSCSPCCPVQCGAHRRSAGSEQFRAHAEILSARTRQGHQLTAADCRMSSGLFALVRPRKNNL